MQSVGSVGSVLNTTSVQTQPFDNKSVWHWNDYTSNQLLVERKMRLNMAILLRGLLYTAATCLVGTLTPGYLHVRITFFSNRLTDRESVSARPAHKFMFNIILLKSESQYFLTKSKHCNPVVAKVHINMPVEDTLLE